MKAVQLLPIPQIDEALTNKFGPEWVNLEDETLSLELGVVFDDLFLAKIRVLKVLKQDPDSVYSDVLYFLHVSEVLNNQDVDPETAPTPDSHELAFTLLCLRAYPPSTGDVGTAMVKEVVRETLKFEGYSEPPEGFFPFLGKDDLDYHGEYSAEDVQRRRDSLLSYVKEMAASD